MSVASRPAQRFGFDRVFQADGSEARSTTDRAYYTLEELRSAEAAAFQRGRDAAEAAQAAIANAALVRIAAAMEAHAAALPPRLDALQAECMAVAHAAARTLAGRALDAFGAERALEVLAAALQSNIQPHDIEICVATSDLPIIELRLEEFSRPRSGRFTLVGRDDLQSGDAMLRMPGGELAFLRSSGEAQITEIFEGALSALHADQKGKSA